MENLHQQIVIFLFLTQMSHLLNQCHHFIIKEPRSSEWEVTAKDLAAIVSVNPIYHSQRAQFPPLQETISGHIDTGILETVLPRMI